MQRPAAEPDFRNTLEALLLANDPRTGVPHLLTLILVLAAAGAIATLSVDVTVRAPGILSPATERHVVRSSIDGVVHQVRALNGDQVRRGDTIVILAENAADQSRSALQSALAAERKQRDDLRRLVRLRMDDGQPVPPPGLHTESGDASAQTALVEWRKGTAALKQAERVVNRTAVLVQRGFAVPVELEAAESEAARAREERTLALEQRRSAWAQAFAESEQRIVTLERDSASRATEASARYLTAPVGGSVEQMIALSAGSVVRALEPVATISPQDNLFVDAAVQPKDVSFIRPGMAARILVEGFDVQQWGTLQAEVARIATDFTVENGQPFFRVQLHLSRAALRGINGRTASIGKGLRGQVRFLVGRKPLRELLRHRVSEWLDPPPAHGALR